MSLFGSIMGDFEDDPIFGHHMRSIRQVNNLMSSLMPDPFGGMFSPFDGFVGNSNHSALTGIGHRNNSLMPFGIQSMPNINRLLAGDFGDNPGTSSYCSSSFMSMTQGPDGRPQVYQATSSTKAGPGGIRETRKTVQDSRTGLKKMAIGHHIGDRAHIIEREQNVHVGTEEERQDFINLDEEEAEDFDKEFTTKASRPVVSAIADSSSGPYIRQTSLPALPAPPSLTSSANTSSRRALRNVSKVSPRRPLRTPTSSPLALTSPSHTTSSTSVHPHPYHTSAARRNYRPKKNCSQTSPNPAQPDN